MHRAGSAPSPAFIGEFNKRFQPNLEQLPFQKLLEHKENSSFGATSKYMGLGASGSEGAGPAASGDSNADLCPRASAPVTRPRVGSAVSAAEGPDARPSPRPERPSHVATRTEAQTPRWQEG